MFKIIFTVLMICLFALPLIGLLDGFKYKKNDNEYLDSARWIDGK